MKNTNVNIQMYNEMIRIDRASIIPNRFRSSDLLLVLDSVKIPSIMAIFDHPQATGNEVLDAVPQ